MDLHLINSSGAGFRTDLESWSDVLSLARTFGLGPGPGQRLAVSGVVVRAMERLDVGAWFGEGQTRPFADALEAALRGPLAFLPLDFQGDAGRRYLRGLVDFLRGGAGFTCIGAGR